jgi:hypothetical protein
MKNRHNFVDIGSYKTKEGKYFKSENIFSIKDNFADK